MRKSKMLILRHLHWINTCSFWLSSSLRGKNTNSEPVYIRSRTPGLKLWWTVPLPSGCFRQITGYRSKCYENWGSFFLQKCKSTAVRSLLWSITGERKHMLNMINYSSVWMQVNNCRIFWDYWLLFAVKSFVIPWASAYVWSCYHTVASLE